MVVFELLSVLKIFLGPAPVILWRKMLRDPRLSSVELESPTEDVSLPSKLFPVPVEVVILWFWLMLPTVAFRCSLLLSWFTFPPSTPFHSFEA